MARLTANYDVAQYFQDVTDSLPPVEPRVVLDDELDFESDLVFMWKGLPFTGIGYDESPELGRSEVTYLHGIQTGPARDWYPSGVLRGESYFVEGTFHVTFREYDSTDALVEETRYEYGVRLFSRFFGLGGNAIEWVELDPDSYHVDVLRRSRRESNWPT